MGRQIKSIVTGAVCALMAVVFTLPSFAEQESEAARSKITNLFDSALNDDATRQEALHKAFMQTALEDAALNACTVLPPDQAYVEEMLLRFSDDGAQSFERRVALVVGNSAYENGIGALKNPSNDANSMARVLRALGFTVHVGLDLDATKLEQCLSGFEQDLSSKRADVALFFYAGHGVQLVSDTDNEKRNYMLATDAGIAANGEGVGFKQIDTVLTDMREHSEQSVFFYDACRNDPLGDNKPTVINGQAIQRAAISLSGAAEVNVETQDEEQGPGIFIAYATSPNRTADDAWAGDAQHSPFTQALLENITRPGVTIQEALGRSFNRVGELTNWRQTPWTSSSLTENLHLNGKVSQSAFIAGSNVWAARAEHLRSQGERSKAIVASLKGLPQPNIAQASALFSLEAFYELFMALNSRSFIIRGHSNAVTSTSFSSNSQHVFTTAWGDETSRVWDSTTGKQLYLLQEDDWPYNGSLSPNSEIAITATFDDENPPGYALHFWNVKSGRRLASISGIEDYVDKISFSPNGDFALTSSDANKTSIWNVRSSKIIHELVGGKADISSDGTKVATAKGNEIYVWDLESGIQIHKFEDEATVAGVTFYSSDENIISVSEDRTITEFEIVTGTRLREIKTPVDISRVVFSPDRKLMATLTAPIEGRDLLRVWNMASGQIMASLPVVKGSLTVGEFSADSRRFITPTAGVARIWDFSADKSYYSAPTLPMQSSDAVFSSDGKYIASSNLAGGFDLRETDTGKLLFSTPDVVGFSFSSDSKAMALAEEGVVRIISTESQIEVAKLVVDSSNVVGVSFLPKSSKVIVRFRRGDGVAKIWDFKSNQSMPFKDVEEEFPAGLSADGKWMLTYSDQQVHIWAVESGDLHISFAVGDMRWKNPIFSPLSDQVLTLHSDNRGRIWSVADGSLLNELKGHDEGIWWAEYSKDGSHIVTTSEDGTARIWDAKSGKEKHVLSAHFDWVTHGTFSEKGNRVATSSYDGSARLWDVTSGRAMQELDLRIWNKEYAEQYINNPNVHSTVFTPDGMYLLTNHIGWFAVWKIGKYEPEILEAAYENLDPSVRAELERERIRYWEVDEELLQ